MSYIDPKKYGNPILTSSFTKLEHPTNQSNDPAVLIPYFYYSWKVQHNTVLIRMSDGCPLPSITLVLALLSFVVTWQVERDMVYTVYRIGKIT